MKDMCFNYILSCDTVNEEESKQHSVYQIFLLIRRVYIYIYIYMYIYIYIYISCIYIYIYIYIYIFLFHSCFVSPIPSALYHTARNRGNITLVSPSFSKRVISWKMRVISWKPW